MTKFANTKLVENQMASILSRKLGTEVDLTIRGETSFTISTEDVDEALEAKVDDLFGDYAFVTSAHDDECGTFVYIEADADAIARATA